MTVHKDFKRLVRSRMTKTGESYTSARAHLLAKPVRRPRRPVRVAPVSTPEVLGTTDYARLAGMSDESIKKNTGCNWTSWVKALDYAGAAEWPHRQIAEYVHTKFKVKDWWTQSVTVGYERIKGLRAIGQRRGGGYEATKSKVYPVAIGRLYRAFSDKRQRNAWLNGAEYTVRNTTANKVMRFNWSDSTSVEVAFYAKGAARAQLALTHRKLPDKAAADRSKAYWTERLTALAGVLSAAPSKAASRR